MLARPKAKIEAKFLFCCEQDYYVPYNKPDASGTIVSVEGFNCTVKDEAVQLMLKQYQEMGGKGTMFFPMMDDVECCVSKKKKSGLCRQPPAYMGGSVAATGFIISDGTFDSLCAGGPMANPKQMMYSNCPCICTPPHIKPGDIEVQGFDMENHKIKFKVVTDAGGPEEMGMDD